MNEVVAFQAQLDAALLEHGVAEALPPACGSAPSGGQTGASRRAHGICKS